MLQNKKFNNVEYENKAMFTWPKVYPAPRGEIPQPHLSSGSDHNKSHMGPS